MRRLPVLAGAVAALVVSFDWFFYGHPVGWTAGAYTLVLCVLVAGRHHRALRSWPGILMGVGVLSVALAMVVQPGGLEYGLAGVGVVGLAMVGRLGWTSRLTRWAARSAAFPLGVVSRPFADLHVISRAARRRRWKLGDLSFGFLLPWLVALVLSTVFVLLFVAANPVVERWADDSTSFVRRQIEALSEALRTIDSGRVLMWLAVGGVAWALFRMRRRPRRGAAKPAAPPPLPGETPLTWPSMRWAFTPAYVVPCLVLFNLVFLVHAGLDAAYLWSGAELPAHLTYAEYAQRGAYPLLASALLAGLFVIVTFGRDSAAADHRAARALVFVWLAQNVWMVVSAVRRLTLYVEAYSLTRWRVAAGVWMAVVVVYLVVLIVRLVRRETNAWFARRAVVVGLLTCLICVWPNFDGLIARFNVTHCRETGGNDVPLDVAYLRGLGPEALPALRWIAGQPGAADRRDEVGAAVAELEEQLRADLADWRGWTLRRARIARDAARLPTATDVVDRAGNLTRQVDRRR